MKLLINNALLTLLCLVILTSSFNAQAAATSTSTSTSHKWERYSVGNKDLTALFPRLPITFTWSQICSEQIVKKYYAYSKSVVYELTVVLKSKVLTDVRFVCNKIARVDQATLDDRIGSLINIAGAKSSTPEKINGKEAIRIVGSTGTTWIINDLVNKRWIEAVIHKIGEINAGDEQFPRALEFYSDADALKVGDGAKKNLGDPDFEKSASDAADGFRQNAALVIVAKPRSAYTDAARKNNIKGSIILDVEFRADGTIGQTVVVRGLKHGLNEEALKAAKKIIFLPERSNDTNVSITKQIEYTFEIY